MTRLGPQRHRGKTVDSRNLSVFLQFLTQKPCFMLSFGEQGRYSATSKVITAVLLGIETWNVKTPCGLAF